MFLSVLQRVRWPMIRNVVTSTLFPVVAFAAMAGVSAEATAADREKQFFQSVEGKWSGPGEIVAGKYKGTKFICNFTGAVPNGQTGMVREGGELGGVKLLQIGTNRVLVEVDGQKKELVIFSGFGSETLLPTGKDHPQ